MTLAYAARPAPIYQELKLRECRTDSPSSSSDTSDYWHGISRKKHRQKTSDEHFESFGLTKRKRSTSNSSKRSESSDENSSLSSSKQTKPASKTTKTTNPEKPCEEQKNHDRSLVHEGSDYWHGISRKKHRQKTSDEHFESFGLTKRKRSTSNSSKRSESSDENSSLSSSKQTKPASKTTKTTNPEKPCEEQKNHDRSLVHEGKDLMSNP